jgi:lipoprotein NlpI
MRLSVAVVFLLLVSGFSAWAQLTGAQAIKNAEQCGAANNPDEALPYCTAAIDSGQLSTENLAATYSNRGIAYKKKGDLDRAIQNYDRALHLSPRMPKRSRIGATPTTRRATSIGRFRTTMKPSGSIPATNAAQLNLKAWPEQVINLYLDKAAPEAVLSAAADSDAKKDQKQHCEAYFYLGEYALIGGKQAEAKRLFQKAIATGLTSSIEYIGAQQELKRMPASESVKAAH